MRRSDAPACGSYLNQARRGGARVGARPRVVGLMPFYKTLLCFSPWLAFLIIARDSLLQVKIALAVAFALTIVMGITKLHRGVLLWAGLAFFAGASIAVIGLDDAWTERHLGVLANGALAAATFLGMAIGRPFTLDYAKSHTDPALWDSPAFLRMNNVLTGAWGAAFVVNLLFAWGKMEGFALPALAYAVLIGAAWITSWYPKYVRAHAQPARG
jgi:hypothetical protein